MLQIKASNIGFRPIIFTRFAAVGENGAFDMGIHDEPAAMYGIEDQIFPSIIEPGETLTFHPLGIDALERNQTDPKDPKVMFNPWKYLVLTDSFGRFHHMNMKDVRWNLQMEKERKPMKLWQKLLEYYQRKRLLRHAKTQLSFQLVIEVRQNMGARMIFSIWPRTVLFAVLIK